LEPSHTWTNFRNISLPCSDEDFFVCEKDSFQFPTPGKNVGIIKHRNILLLRGLDILTLDSRLAAIEESKAGPEAYHVVLGSNSLPMHVPPCGWKADLLSRTKKLRGWAVFLADEKIVDGSNLPQVHIVPFRI